jgi:hypothetical protein
MIGTRSISIWFFIGTLLLIYGVIIFIANVADYYWPSTGRVIVLGELHFGIWWGVLLIAIGTTYFVSFRPWKKK